MSNVFIQQKHGPEKLAVAFPVNVDFSRIPELASLPDSVTLHREARARRRFFEPFPGDVPLFEGERTVTHELDTDRDLNGAGLVYFANFIAFIDRAERTLLGALPDPVPAPILDARSTYRRMIGFYGNARGNDQLWISCSAHSRPYLGSDLESTVDFGFDCSIRRASDGKEIVLSSCRKIAPCNGDHESAAWWRRRHG